ncbi:ALP1-like protein [Tanacetum coccineum]
MASESASTTTGVGSTSALTIREIIPTNRTPEVWKDFNMCIMTNGQKKAQCKYCFHFLSEGSNTTLKNHITHPHCEVLKAQQNQNPEAGQTSMGRDGQIFMYNPDYLREQFAGLVIQRGLPFNHFDHEQTTRVFQNTMQPRYTHVSRSTLKRDAMKLWVAAKQATTKIHSLSWQGQYGRGDEKYLTIMLEVVASQDLWIWHVFYGMAGANNDINVLDNSPLFDDLLDDLSYVVPYVVNGVEYRNGYYLADGIYPEWASFVKSFTVATDQKHTYFKQRQESARKDVKRTFGDLQGRWGLIQQPARAYEVNTLRRIMYAGIIMHNMIFVTPPKYHSIMATEGV